MANVKKKPTSQKNVKGSTKANTAKKKSSSASSKKSAQSKGKRPISDKEYKKRKKDSLDYTSKHKKQKDTRTYGSISKYPFLMAVKPHESYIFRSNDYQSDGNYYTMLSFFHREGMQDKYPPFWGIGRIPMGLENVSVVNVMSVERMAEGWVKQHQTQSENVAQMNSSEQQVTTSKTNKNRANKREIDLDVVSQELDSGASYLRCAFRMQVKAKSYEDLEDALKIIERFYMDQFSTLYCASYDGEQKNELSTFLRPIAYKKGKPFYFTSTELAGEYSIITRGIEDDNGDYVGKMSGDINTAGVFVDLNMYRHHVVIASEQIDKSFGYRAHVSSLWGSKIGQTCLFDDHKVVHMILDDTRLDHLGPAMASITRTLDMNIGDLNMFEVFGAYDDELTLFPMQMQKLILMAEQAYDSTDSDRSIIRGSLEEIATKFYVEQGMWYTNAVENRQRIRITGIPHNEVPMLQVFSAYLDEEYKAATVADQSDEEKLHALAVLNLTFKNLLNNNGDLFNTITNPVIDDMVDARRAIYDFSDLIQRGQGIMMAQFLNVIMFATQQLGEGDSLIIHGAEYIVDSVKDFLSTVFEQLYSRGGRVVFCYNDILKALKDEEFDGFDKSDYTIFGNMTDNACALYQDQLGQTIPSNMAKVITRRNDYLTFLHRQYQNVIFNRDLILYPRGAKK